MHRRSCALAFLLAATACTGSDPAASPGSLPPPSALPTTTPTATAAAAKPSLPPVVKPAGADEATAAGAALFAQYWYDEMNRAYDMLDSARIVELSDKRCQTCQNYIKDIDAAAEAGDRYLGGGFQVISAVAPAITNASTVVTWRYDSRALIVNDRAGKRITSFPPRSRVISQVLVTRRSAGWLVREVKDTV